MSETPLRDAISPIVSLFDKARINPSMVGVDFKFT